MADESNGTDVVESVQTPAPAQSAEPTAPEPSQAPQTEPVEPSRLDDADPWANLGKETESDTEKTTDKAVEAPKTDEKPAETPADDAEKAKTAENDDEIKALDELLASDKPIDPEKTEAEKEEELDKQDPAAMEAGQRNAVTKAYLQRTQKYAAPLRDLKYGKIEPEAALTQLESVIGSDKIAALKKVAAHELVDSNPDATFQRAYVRKMLAKDPAFDYTKAEIPTLDDLVNGKLAPVKEAAPAAEMAELEELTKDLSAVLEFDWRDPANDERFIDDRELAMAKALRGLEARAKTQSPELEAAKLRLQELEKAEAERAEAEKAKTNETATVEVQHATSEAIQNYQTSVEELLMPRIFAKNQLTPDPADTPEIVDLKKRMVELYTGDDKAKELGQPSAFENFAYYRSSVADKLVERVQYVTKLQRQYAEAKVAKDAAKMAEVEKLAVAERLPIMRYLIDADREFYAAQIKPIMDLAGASSQRAAPIKQASARVEVVSNAGSAPATTPKRVDAATADDVWGNMVKTAAEDDRARANA